MNNPIHVISLGAGVQSSTMALMAAKGEITPMPNCAIFAAQAIEVDEKLRSFPATEYRQKGILYLHRSGKPLREIDFRTQQEKHGQVDMFQNECEGMCGV